MLLSRLKQWRSRIDDLTEGVFRALEGIED